VKGDRKSTTWRVALVTAAVAIATVGTVASPAAADTGVIPQSDALPWTDPAHQSPLEQLMNRIASNIAQRPVRIYCDGENDWARLAADNGFDASAYNSWVIYRYSESSRTFSESSDVAHIRPEMCRLLWRYAMATEKPTKCATVIEQTKKVVTTIKVAKKVRTRVKVRGKWKVVTKTVRVPKKVTKQVTQEVPGPPEPCYTGIFIDPAAPPEYPDIAFALMELGRDAVYLLEFQVGRSIDTPWEVRARCLSMQLVPWIATQFGATLDDGRAIASYAYNVFYQSWQTYSFWSPDCAENGSLDVSPRDGVWP
jgi:hypothetical protein